ncbi:MAG: hypothetical protein LQ350_002456 [Teloschistes chrysophthalmus]|nr:MAG: hypothetical protein LQ350_002456 [Niorma chrysophthalma]
MGPRHRPGNVWSSAEVIKAQEADSTTFAGGRGYPTKFEYSPTPNPARRCIMLFEGGVQKLTLTLVVNNRYKDPKPETLHRFEIPTENALLILRLYQKGIWMEIHIDPKQLGKEKPVGDYWSIRFRLHNDMERKQTRSIMQRIESTTRQQPDVWFKYRNYFTATARRPMESLYRHDLSSGHQFTFTGRLATEGFLNALKVPVAKTAATAAVVNQPLVSQPRLTRSMVNPAAYKFSSLQPEQSVSLKTVRKLGVAALKDLGVDARDVSSQRVLQLGRQKYLEKREAARAKKAPKQFPGKLKAPVPLPKLSFAPVVIPEGDPKTAASGGEKQAELDSSDSSDTYYTAESGEGPREPPKSTSVEPPNPNTSALNQAAATGGQKQVAISSEESSDSEEGPRDSQDDASAVEYPINAIIDDGVNSDGDTMYLVDYEDDDEPSWQPEIKLSAEALGA